MQRFGKLNFSFVLHALIFFLIKQLIFKYSSTGHGLKVWKKETDTEQQTETQLDNVPDGAVDSC